MADYVLLESAGLNNRIRVVVHTTVPNGNNAVGNTWKSALVEYLGDTASQVPVSVLPVGRQADLDAGDVYEWSFSFEDDANAPTPTRLANLEAEILALEAGELSRLQNVLRYWGRTATVT